jgi:sugar O-acyltransferase (sialic acid O-acetyltransferase NeuD family)
MPGTRFVVVGAGGHAKVVVSTIEACGDQVLHVLDDDESRRGSRILGHEVKGPIAADLVPADAVVVLAVGSNKGRAALAQRLAVTFGRVIHPSAVIHPSVIVGEGTVVFAGAVIQPDTRIGRHCIINTSASIDHDGEIGSFVHLAPGAHLAGQVTVGDGTLIGVGSSVIPQMVIGAWSIVGAGSAVIGEVADGVTVGGSPARVLNKE